MHSEIMALDLISTINNWGREFNEKILFIQNNDRVVSDRFRKEIFGFIKLYYSTIIAN